jgi:hypothetical protein
MAADHFTRLRELYRRFVALGGFRSDHKRIPTPQAELRKLEQQIRAEADAIAAEQAAAKQKKEQ